MTFKATKKGSKNQNSGRNASQKSHSNQVGGSTRSGGPTRSSTSRRNKTAQMQTSMVPKFTERITVRARDYCRDILQQSVLDPSVSSNQAFINPGNTEVFPRLSYLASAFEKYEFKQLKFIYAATSPFVTNGAFMGFLETDLLDEPPGTKGEILNHKNCFRSAVFEDCSFSVSKKDLVGQRYVRSTEAVESGRDNRLDHLGKLYFGTYGCASTTVGDAAGELWIDYEVDLISPCVPTSGIISAATGLEFSNTVAVPYVPIGGQNYLNCITASTQLVPSSSNYTDNLQNDARYSLFASGPLAGLVGITLPPGTYEVIMRLLGAKTATTTAGWNLYKYEDLLASLVSPTWWDGTLAGGGSSDYISYAAKWILNTNATNNSQSSSSGPVPSFYIRCAEAALAFTFANLRITKLADSPGRFITN